MEAIGTVRTTFAGTDPDALLTEAEAARLLSLSVRSLQGWRVKRSDGPAFVKCGRAVRYRRRDLVAWMERNTVRSTGDGGA